MLRDEYRRLAGFAQRVNVEALLVCSVAEADYGMTPNALRMAVRKAQEVLDEEVLTKEIYAD